MKTTLEDVTKRLDTFLGEFVAAGEDLQADHEFIANFVGTDEALGPTYDRLLESGFSGDPPNGGGWIYMHVRRPLTRESVLQLSLQLQELSVANQCLFELLDVAVVKPNKLGSLVILGATDA